MGLSLQERYFLSTIGSIVHVTLNEQRYRGENLKRIKVFVQKVIELHDKYTAYKTDEERLEAQQPLRPLSEADIFIATRKRDEKRKYKTC